MSQFDITFDDRTKISGEYRAGNHLVIFSHGFDVRRDSNGLFHDIASSLPDGWGYVLFDYHNYLGSVEALRPLSEQAAVLRHVVSWTKNTIPAIELHLIAHSMGCTVAAYAAVPQFETVTFLAPPVHSGGGLRKFFENHPGTQPHPQGYLVERRSGKTTLVSERFLQEFESAEPLAFLIKYAGRGKHIRIMTAAHDQFIPPASYDHLRQDKRFSVMDLAGDHNFSDAARPIIIQYVRQSLTDRRVAT